MQRNLLNALTAWKNQPVRKPLLIDGARQTGKTYLLQELFGNSFANILRIDFLENPAYKEAFDGSLSPDELVMNIELLTNQAFNPETDLLILDEIGECERAVTSLKYFAEKSTVLFCRCQRLEYWFAQHLPRGQGRTIQFTTTDLPRIYLRIQRASADQSV